LHLGLRGQDHGVVARLRLLAEQHGAQAVHGVARPGSGDHGTEAADGEHRRGS
jgi:hypothetical protein